MIHVTLACSSSMTVNGFGCPSFHPPAHVKFEEVDGWINATLAEHGWTTLGDAHYCPQHDPATTGEIIQIGTDYTELAPGVRVRLPGSSHIFGDTFPLEVLRERAVASA